MPLPFCKCGREGECGTAEKKTQQVENYDYSSIGAYFVTICTEEKRMTLCEIVGDGLPVPYAGKRDWVV